jgi:hypothetical protein
MSEYYWETQPQILSPEETDALNKNIAATPRDIQEYVNIYNSRIFLDIPEITAFLNPTEQQNLKAHFATEIRSLENDFLIVRLATNVGHNMLGLKTVPYREEIWAKILAAYSEFEKANVPYFKCFGSRNLIQQRIMILDKTIFTPNELELLDIVDITDEKSRIMTFDTYYLDAQIKYIRNKP